MKKEYYSKLKDSLYIYRWWFVCGIIAVLIFDSSNLAIPWALKIAIESLKNPTSSAHGVSYYAFIIVILACSGFLFRLISRYFLFGASRYMEYDLRRDIFGHLLRLSPKGFSKFRIGDLISRASNDLNTIKMFIGFGILTIISTCFTYIVALCAMFSLSPRLTLLSLIPLPLIVLVVKKVTPKMYSISRETQDMLGEISNISQETVSGIQTIKAFVQEEKNYRRFIDYNKSYYSMRLKLVKYMGLIFPLMGMLSGVGTLIVLWQGGAMVINKEITLGDFVAFNTYLGMLIWPSIALGWIFTLIQRGLASFARVCEVFDEIPTITDDESENDSAILSGDIEIKDLTFSYGSPSDDSGNEPGRNVIDGVSLTIKEGETLVIVGPTGSGKTTLAKLITRLIEVPEGAVYIDGKDITKVPVASLRKSIGYIPQEGFIFHNSIRENIGYGLDNGNGGMNPDMLAKAAEIADFLKDIEGFPDGMETRVGERGVTLSGGQRQRLTLARMLVCDPNILILDDSLSSVDTHTERNIMENLRDILKKKTSIVITHRISPLKYADRIAVIDNGKLAELGTHGELMQKRGTYFKLYTRQALTEEMEEL
ncbi:MAG: ABC transporter ATP-binding protein [Candidatus Schekmanbacteria bacterium]|nr:ABC transporter ATP-binding protein [Candidatus Schekmanbacteria bacterium]